MVQTTAAKMRSDRHLRCAPAYVGASIFPPQAGPIILKRTRLESHMTHPQLTHAQQPVLAAGTPLTQARIAVLLLHGRGGTAAGMLTLADELRSADTAFLAPQAAGNTWYPFSFLTPLERNEPWLSGALDKVAATLRQCVDAGIPPARTVIVGFSQGACLGVEFAAREAQRYGGVACLSGGLIGPAVISTRYTGDFGGTPAFLGCSDVDSHIPVERVRESAAILEELGAAVTLQLYPGMGHTINEDELGRVRTMLGAAKA
jgi:phospholipase/carboxylesterase